MDRYLIVGADFVGVMNRHGAERMRVDGMVVQQVLRGLGVHRRKDNGTEGESGAVGVGLGLRDDVQANSDENATGGGNMDDEDDALLTQSSQYYELFLQGPDAIMEYVKDRKARGEVGYSYDELRTLIELCFSAGVRGADREESLKARKRMGDLLLGLGEIMWDS